MFSHDLIPSEHDVRFVELIFDYHASSHAAAEAH